MNISTSDLLAQLARAQQEMPFIDDAEARHGILPFLLYAVGSRETNLRNIRGDFSKRPHDASARFHGFGVWQRDSDAFGVGPAYLGDVPKQADDAARLLAANFDRFQRWDAATAAYNAGPGNVSRALSRGLSVDSFTTGADYSADVLGRRAVLAGGHVSHGGGSNGHTHIVVAGDTLGALAHEFGTTVALLAAVNHIPDPNRIQVGQVLVIPTAGHVPAVVHGPGGQIHVVVPGDTLSQLALTFHTTVQHLVQLNHLADPDVIIAGQPLKVA